MADDNSGGRSLGGGSSEPLPAGWGSQSSERRVGRIGDWSNPSSNSRGVRSLRDINPGGGGLSLPLGGPGPQGDDDSDDDDEGNGEGESWFAGGERSGLSIQNPDRPGAVPGGRMVRDLLRRAEQEGASGPTSHSSAFAGSGNRLGSDESPSEYIPDPSASQVQPTIRTLTFWRDGFSVEDGELMRYDNPENAQVLAQLQAGHAPPSILNVEQGEPVDVQVVKRLSEDYPVSSRPFAGTGHRLGAPVPEASSSSMPGSFSPPAASSSAAPEPSSITAKFEVDQSKPTTSVQIRLADGTKLVCRMNLTHTVLDLRNFINAARPENLTRPYTIGTTFPNRTLDDNTATVEGAGLKNSVVVQRWV